MSGLSINEIVGFHVESTAEWRRQKAQQFPDDSRNLRAADELERLAGEISALEGTEIHRQIDKLFDLAHQAEADSDLCCDLNESVSAELRSIGFHGSYGGSGAAFLEWYRDNLEALLREHINDDDSTVAAPDLKEQIENDPAVKAAKQRYEEARAKAYEKARKLL
jgi:hypothetical protein